MNAVPLFSIIIPTYNRAHIILRAIESVKIQTFSDWELVIVDDGSTDHTEDIIRKIDDPRINYFKKNHAERSAARNFGIEKAKGKYICFLDSDDYFLKDHLEVHAEVIKRQDYPIASFYSGSYVEINNSKIKDIHLFSNQKPVEDLWKHGFNLLPFSFYNEIFKSIRLDEELVFMEDLDLLLKIFKHFPINPIFKYTNVHVIHKERSTSISYKAEVKKHGDMHIFSIDRIIQRHYFFLKKFMRDKNIQARRNKTIMNFIKASIKNMNPVLTFYFIYHYLNKK